MSSVNWTPLSPKRKSWWESCWDPGGIPGGIPPGSQWEKYMGFPVRSRRDSTGIPFKFHYFSIGKYLGSHRDPSGRNIWDSRSIPPGSHSIPIFYRKVTVGSQRDFIGIPVEEIGIPGQILWDPAKIPNINFLSICLFPASFHLITFYKFSPIQMHWRPKLTLL